MTLYLIAHKLCGERAFDIAVKMERPDGPDGPEEPWWIIPTSGHRAYPYWWYPLGDLFAYENIGPPPADLRDHYEVSRDPPAPDYTNRATDSPRSGRPIVPTLEDI